MKGWSKTIHLQARRLTKSQQLHRYHAHLIIVRHRDLPLVTIIIGKPDMPLRSRLLDSARVKKHTLAEKRSGRSKALRQSQFTSSTPRQIPTSQDLVASLRTKKRVVVVAGAGISASAGSTLNHGRRGIPADCQQCPHSPDRLRLGAFFEKTCLMHPSTTTTPSRHLSMP